MGDVVSFNDYLRRKTAEEIPDLEVSMAFEETPFSHQAEAIRFVQEEYPPAWPIIRQVFGRNGFPPLIQERDGYEFAAVPSFDALFKIHNDSFLPRLRARSAAVPGLAHYIQESLGNAQWGWQVRTGLEHALGRKLQDWYDGRH